MGRRIQTPTEMGGEVFVLSATDIKMLGKLTDILKQQRTLYRAQLEINNKIFTLETKSALSGKAETKNYQERLKTLHKIYDQMQKVNEERAESFLAMHPYIPRTSGPQVEEGPQGRGRYDYSPEAAAITGTAEKRVEEGRKEITVLDVLKKKYAWQLLYFTAVAGVMEGMVANSKILQHFQNVIGAGLGFILDMLLVALIPAVIVLVGWLFQIGEFFSGLPDPVKIAVLALMALFAIFTGAQAVVWLSNLAYGVTGVGTAAKVAAGMEGVGALNAALGVLGGLLAGAFVVKIMDESGMLKSISESGKGLREGMFGGIIRAAGEATVGPMANALNIAADVTGYKGGRFETGMYQSSHQDQAPVNVYIEGQALDKSQFRYQRQNQLYNGVGL